MKESNLVVFVLGAGASAHFGSPVMRNFMNTARRRYFERKGHFAKDDFIVRAYSTMFDFYDKCLKSSWAFLRDWDNIEELYTQADLRRLAGITDESQVDTVCKHIAWSIWDVYRRMTIMPDFTGICSSIQSAGLEPVVITTNYDMLVERQLHQSKTKYYYPGFELPNLDNICPAVLAEDKSLFRYQSPWVPIVKLHGSVNWFSINEKRMVALVDGETASEIASPWFGREGILKYLADSSQGPITEEFGVTPAIVPPMLGKSANVDVIANQWKVAVDALSQARHVWVIGYSFPPTDAFMSRLLTEGVQDNRDLDLFCIVDAQFEREWRGRINSLFNPAFLSQRFEFWRAEATNAYSMMMNSPFPNWVATARSNARRVRSNDGG